MAFIPDNNTQQSSGFKPDVSPNAFVQLTKRKKMKFSDMYRDILEIQNKKDEQADALQKLLGQTMPVEEAAKTARGFTQDKLGLSMDKLRNMESPNPDVNLKLQLTELAEYGEHDIIKQQSQELIHNRLEQYAGEIQDEIQAGYDFSRWEANADKLREKFSNKTYRAWERGSVHVVGGGLHLLEELTIGAEALGGSMDPKAQAEAREMYGDMARVYHKVLDTPEMQQVVDSTWEKYLLGGIETAPFIIASAAPALLTGGTSIPSGVGSFLTAYAVESNSAYQSGVDRDDPNARARGIVTGLINGGIEMVGGGGRKYLNNAVETAVGKLGRLKKFGTKTLHTALREGLMEEVPQEMVSMVIGGDYPRTGTGAIDWDSVTTRLMDTAITGIILGGVLEAPFAARHAITMPSTPKQAKATKDKQETEAVAVEQVSGATDNMTGFDDKQNVGVPDYIAPTGKRAGAVKSRDAHTKVAVDKEAVVVREQDRVAQTPTSQREETIQQLTEEYTESGMDPEKAAAWALKTVGEETNVVDAEGNKTNDVVYYEPPQTHLEHIPAVDPPPVQVTDKETAEALAEKYNITGQEALKIMKEQRKENDAPQTEADVLSESLEVQDKIAKRGTPTERMNRRGFFKHIQKGQDEIANAYSRFRRFDRMTEALDGHAKNGPIRKATWGRIRPASLGRKQAIAEGWDNFKKMLGDMDIDYSKWASKVETIAPGIKLTKAQQLGVYLSYKNKHGKRYITHPKGMNISEDSVKIVQSRVLSDPDLKAVANWMQGQLQRNWAGLYDAGIQMGIDPKLLQQESEYFSIMRTDKESINNPQDVMSLISDRLPNDTTDKGIVTQRKEGAVGEIELDAFVIYLNNVTATENFKWMGPVAAEVSKVTGNPRFRKALNRATYGHGTDIMDKWLKDSVRGTSGDKMDWLSKRIRPIRYNVKQYFMGFKVLSAFRQITSTPNGLMMSPLVAYEYGKIVKGITGNWKSYENIRKEAESKSIEVKYRSWDRHWKRKWTSEDARDYMIGKQRYDKKAIWMMRKMDKFAVVTVWMSNYRYAKDHKDMSEPDAIEFADTVIGKTQPMADSEYLPDFFRGGEISKALSDFQQMPNQVANIVGHDIIGARRAGKITNSMAGYRFLMAVLLPSILLGSISRGRPQKSLWELLTDLIMYPINAVPLAGPWLGRAIRGWSNGSSLTKVPLEEMERLFQEIKEGDVPGIAKRTATTIGSLTGKFPHQAVLTIGGALDLASGKTKDPRRLLWSEYQLKDDDESGGTQRNRTTTKRSSRRTSR